MPARAWCGVVGLEEAHTLATPRRPFGPAGPFIDPSTNVLYPMSTQCLLPKEVKDLWKTRGRLARLVNDIRYVSFIIVGLPGKLQKRERLLPIFKRENKGIKLTKMV